VDTRIDAPGTSSWPAAPQQRTARIDAAGLTDTGRARPVNEDSFLIATLQRSLVVHDASPAARGWFTGEPAGTLLVVADGMGGQGGGDVASKVGVDTVVTYLLNCMPWKTLPAGQAAPRSSLPGVRDALSSALVAGDETVKTAGVQTGAPHMGTTLTMAFVLWPNLYIAHVGDTRCYLLRSGQLQRLTTDHTVAQQIAEISAKPVEASSHLHHVLWNCLGGSDEQPRPEVARRELKLGDVLLLCSDGLTKHLDDQRINQVLGAGGACAARAAKLVELANQAGGSDNITALVAQAMPPGSSDGPA
jgi:PPM family protein phosphatase